jgi:CRP/FNR family transcriptional regulator, anaerobic regulatory protein
MDYSAILKNIDKHITLDEKDAARFTSLLSYREVKKKESLLREGELCRNINYVQSGVLRAYYLDKEGNENIIMFAINDWWVTDIYSFATGNPAVMHIDALENSEIFQLSKNDLENLFREVPGFERFFRIIMQNSYIREQLRSIQNLSLSAEERYLNFTQKYPDFMQRISQKQIASYLGITPEFLSVIRSKLRKGS